MPRTGLFEYACPRCDHVFLTAAGPLAVPTRLNISCSVCGARFQLSESERAVPGSSP